jgi:hypothetical protein
MVKIFTMVKGEDDIVEDWVLYHGHLFGFKNLHIIDNYSRDNTFPLLVTLRKKYGINIYRLPDYTKKGIYMTTLFKKFCKSEFGFPIDIDEFIVYYDEKTNSISCDRNVILEKLFNLKRSNVYKMNYINSKIMTENGYSRAAVESTWGSYTSYGTQAKSFFHSNLFNDVIDHGNHYNTNNYLLTPFCLVHFHTRNMNQIKKKVYNNVSGLGHNPFNLKKLENSLRINKHAMQGFHHVIKQINILKHTFTIPVETHLEKDISLIPLNEVLMSMKK